MRAGLGWEHLIGEWGTFFVDGGYEFQNYFGAVEQLTWGPAEAPGALDESTGDFGIDGFFFRGGFRFNGYRKLQSSARWGITRRCLRRGPSGCAGWSRRLPCAKSPTICGPVSRRSSRGERPRQVYAAHRRSVHRAEDPELGAIAIKELRNPSLPRQLWFGWFAEHPGVREYRVGIAFAARGGRTLTSLGAALERSPLRARARAALHALAGWRGDPHALARRAGRAAGAAPARSARVADRGGRPARARAPPAQLEQPAGGDAARRARSSTRSTFRMRRSARGSTPPASPSTWRGSRAGSCTRSCGPARPCRPSSKRSPPRCSGETPPGDDLAARMARELEAVIRDPSARRPARA